MEAYGDGRSRRHDAIDDARAGPGRGAARRVRRRRVLSAETRVWHYDGRSALRRLRGAEAAATVPAGRAAASGPVRLRRSGGRATPIGRQQSIGLKRRPGWRIGFVGALPPEIAAKLPRQARYGGVVDRFGLWPSVGGRSRVRRGAGRRGRAAGPRRWSRGWSRSRSSGGWATLMVGDFGAANGCAGRRARRRCTRWCSGSMPTMRRSRCSVVDLPMVNAVTLPGGRIVIFDGLLADGEVARRDRRRARARDRPCPPPRRDRVAAAATGAVSVLLGGLEGQCRRLHQRAARHRLFARGGGARGRLFAIDLLRDAAISPADTAGFFRRLGKGDGKAERDARLSREPSGVERPRAGVRRQRRRPAYRPALDASNGARWDRSAAAGRMGWRF